MIRGSLFAADLPEIEPVFPAVFRRVYPLNCADEGLLCAPKYGNMPATKG